MRILITVCILISSQLWVIAQDVIRHDFDLQEKLLELRTSKPDTNRISILHDIGKFYLFKSGQFKSDIDSAIYCFGEAVKLSNALPLPIVKIRSFRNENLCRLGEAYFQQGDTVKANQCFRDVIRDYHEIEDVGREARTWLRFGKKTLPSNNPLIILYFLKALELYQMNGDKIKEAEVLLAIGSTHKNQNKLDAAQEALSAALKIYDSLNINNYNHILTYAIAGEVKRYRGDFNGAISDILKAIQLRDASVSKSQYQLTILNQALAPLYSELGQSEESVRLYRKAIEYLGDVSYEMSTFYAYWYACDLVDELIKLHRATDAMNEIKALIEKRPPKTDLENASAAQALGSCYSALHHDDLAEKSFRDMIRYYENGNFLPIAFLQSEILAQGYFEISKFYIDRWRYDDAKEYLQKITNVTPGILTLSQRRDLQMMFFKADSASGNYVGAIEHFRAQQAVNDSIYNIAKSRQIAELQIQYETKKKEQDLKLLQNESQLNRSQLNLTVGGIILLIITLGFVYSRYRTKQISNSKLQLQQAEINRKNASLEKLVKEKEWLLKEIHHRVKNNLQMIMSLLDTQSDYLKNDAAQEAVLESKHRMRAISLIHQKLYRTDSVSEINMSVYAAELTDYLRESFHTDYRIDFRVDVQAVKLDIALAIPLGLILNEAITNSIKYAFPSNATGWIMVSLVNETADDLLLTVADNGIGLPANFNNTHNSFGMNLITTLCEQIEADLNIISDKGTQLKVSFSY